MFTGIMEEVGKIQSISRTKDGTHLEIVAKTVLEDTKLGDSIAVNGVCLTVTAIKKNSFVAFVMAESLRCSNLANLKQGDIVHLERAMPANGRFGGHIVTGHIDGQGVLYAKKQEGAAVVCTVCADASILSGIVKKGSIAIDGISLTIMDVTKEAFCVGIIPHTADHTTLLQRPIGYHYNLETDVIGKYIQKCCTNTTSITNTNITIDFLKENGF